MVLSTAVLCWFHDCIEWINFLNADDTLVNRPYTGGPFCIGLVVSFQHYICTYACVIMITVNSLVFASVVLQTWTSIPLTNMAQSCISYEDVFNYLWPNAHPTTSHWRKIVLGAVLLQRLPGLPNHDMIRLNPSLQLFTSWGYTVMQAPVPVVHCNFLLLFESKINTLTWFILFVISSSRLFRDSTHTSLNTKRCFYIHIFVP